MSSQETAAAPPNQKLQLGLIMKLVAVFDFALAAAIIVFGPAYIDGGPSTDVFIRLAGVGLGAAAVVVFWIGHRFAAGAKGNDNVVQRRRNGFSE